MGITQHKNGVANVQSIVNFALLRGQIGRRGAGLCPVRGHSNVQGDRTVGIWEKMSPEFLEALGKEFDFAPPREARLRHRAHDRRRCTKGKVKVFIGAGWQFPVGDARHQLHRRRRCQRCALTVQISTKLNRGHLITGRAGADPALPRPHRARPCRRRASSSSASRTRPASCTSRAACSSRPPSICAASRRSSPASPRATLGGRTTVDWRGLVDDYDRIREHIEHVVPGFTQYNQRVRAAGRLLSAERPARGQVHDAVGPRAASRCIRSRARRGSRPGSCC